MVKPPSTVMLTQLALLSSQIEALSGDDFLLVVGDAIYNLPESALHDLLDMVADATGERLMRLAESEATNG